MGIRTSGGGCKALSIRRDVAAVYFDVFQITCVAQRSQQKIRNSIRSAMWLVFEEVTVPGWVNHCGLIKCMIAYGIKVVEACYHATINVSTVKEGW